RLRERLADLRDELCHPLRDHRSDERVLRREATEDRRRPHACALCDVGAARLAAVLGEHLAGRPENALEVALRVGSECPLFDRAHRHAAAGAGSSFIVARSDRRMSTAIRTNDATISPPPAANA